MPKTSSTPITGNYHPTPELIAAIGKRAKVHWHVTKKTYSIAVGGKVIGYAPRVTMQHCVFKIDARLRKAFTERPNRRTVHALIVGDIASYEAPPIDGETVLCNPFLFATFVRASDNAHALSAARIVLHADKRIEAVALITDISV